GQRIRLRLLKAEQALMVAALPVELLAGEDVEAKFAGEAALPAHEDGELLFVGNERVHCPAVDELDACLFVVADFASCQERRDCEVFGDVALAVANLLALVADEAAEAPGLNGDALGDDLLHVAVGLKVFADAGAMRLPVALTLEGGCVGRDGVDAVG